jgi:hypothetical protein
MIKNPGAPQSSRVFLSEGVPSLTVESDAGYLAGPKTAAYGVGCWATREQGYIFAVTPGAAWAILKWDNGAAPPQTVLAASDTEHAIPGFSDSNRIRGECVGGGGKPTALALYVNEKKIGTAEDVAGPASFPGFGLSVFSTEAGADVEFDNFAAREP